MAQCNMTAQSKDISEMIAGGDGKFRPHDLTGAYLNNPQLAHITALNYQGAFRLPGAGYGVSSLNYQRRPVIGLNHTTGGLLISGEGDANVKTIAEFSIPALVKELGDVVSNLNMGANTQPFINVIDQDDVNDDDFEQGRTISGLYEKDGEIIINAFSYYDSVPFNTDTTIVKRNSSNINLSVLDTDGSYKLDGATHSAGWISDVPAAWQVSLGGTHLSGHSSGTSRTINARHSVGPSAWIWDAADVLSPNNPAGGSAITATAVIDYPLTDFLGVLDPYDSNDLDLPSTAWTNVSEAAFGFIIPNTETYMVLGRSGGHISGTDYKIRSNGYDSVDAEDYDNHYWLYDVNDLIAVKNGTTQAHEPQPYAHGELVVPFGGSGSNINGITGGAYDAATDKLYLALADVDDQGYVSDQPVIIVYTLDGDA